MKKIKRMISLLITLTFMLCLLVFVDINDLYVYAENKVEIDSTNMLSVLKEESMDSEYNIMLYDEDWNIINEFHIDGEIVEYSYQDDSICEITNTNGYSTYISDNGNSITITNYKAGVLNNTYNIVKEKINYTMDVENVTALMDAASKGELEMELLEIEESNISIYADTISNGYNLSTMCPSVWTAAVGHDKFVRPSTALDESSIQSFLESKNSILANDIIVYRKDSNGNVYNTGISVRPSNVIHNASRDYHINPKIILGSLQREQGLISKTTGDVSTRAFYFCMGYGATDDGDINGYTGFDTQIDEGTHRYLELWYEGYLLGQSGFPVSFAASDGTIQINNCGTYALFRYTPWQSSNRLFLDILDGYWPDSNGVNGINWE